MVGDLFLIERLLRWDEPAVVTGDATLVRTALLAQLIFQYDTWYAVEISRPIQVFFGNIFHGEASNLTSLNR